MTSLFCAVLEERLEAGGRGFSDFLETRFYMVFKKGRTKATTTDKRNGISSSCIWGM